MCLQLGDLYADGVLGDVVQLLLHLLYGSLGSVVALLQVLCLPLTCRP